MENYEKVEEVYESIRKKHKLPSFKELSKKFPFPLKEITPTKEGVIKSVLIEIEKNLFWLGSSIENLLTARSFSAFHERKALTEGERARAFKLFKQTQMIVWEARASRIKGNADSVECLKKTIKFWDKKLKKELIWFNTRISTYWKKASKPDFNPRT